MEEERISSKSVPGITISPCWQWIDAGLTRESNLPGLPDPGHAPVPVAGIALLDRSSADLAA